jgi:hypothetical protein
VGVVVVTMMVLAVVMLPGHVLASAAQQVVASGGAVRVLSCLQTASRRHWVGGRAGWGSRRSWQLIVQHEKQHYSSACGGRSYPPASRLLIALA